MTQESILKLLLKERGTYEVDVLILDLFQGNVAGSHDGRKERSKTLSYESPFPFLDVFLIK